MRSTLLLLPVSFAVAVPLSAQQSVETDTVTCAANQHKLSSSEYGLYEYSEDGTPRYYLNNAKEVDNKDTVDNKNTKWDNPKEVLFCCTDFVGSQENSNTAKFEKRHNSTAEDEKSSSTTVHSGNNVVVFVSPPGDASGCFPLTPFPDLSINIGNEEPIPEDPDPFNPNVDTDPTRGFRDEEPTWGEDPDPFNPNFFPDPTGGDTDPTEGFPDPDRYFTDIVEDLPDTSGVKDPFNLVYQPPTVPDGSPNPNEGFTEPEILPWWLSPSEVTLNSGGVPTKDDAPAKHEVPAKSEVPAKHKGKGASSSHPKPETTA